jgi:putative PEP-CTERM system TPR-repeat lipoprotein
MMSNILRYLSAVLLALSISASANAADQKRAESYVRDAQKALDRGDAKSAVIELKNAVQADPSYGAARYELGSVELQLGDYLSAEKELRAAIERGYDRDKVAAPLADTLLRLHKEEELLDQIPAGDRPAGIEGRVRLARGYAQLTLNRRDDAKKSFEDSLARSTRPGPAELGLARVFAMEGKTQDALDATQKALDGEPNFAEAWDFHAKLKRAQGDLTTARADLDKALAISPNYESGRLDRASLLIATNDLALATADLKAVLEKNPKHPLAAYYQALIQAKQQDYRRAQASLQGIGGFIDQYPPAIYLSAAVDVALNQLAQAEETIGRFLGRVPEDEAGTALLANLLVRRGNLSRAIEVTRSALDAHPGSLRLMGVLSDAYSRNQQPEEAAAILDRAAAAHPDDAELRTRIGAERLRIGRPDEALADLETAAALSPKSEQAGLLLVLTLLQTNKIDQALKAAEGLRDNLPGDPVPENLLGAIALRKGDRIDAKAHFEKALQIKPDFNPAAINLAQLAIAERHYDDAGAIYDRILTRDPVNQAALMAEADLSIRQGQPDAAILWLEKARNGDPSAVPPRLRLIEGYVRLKETSKASSIAAELERIAPDDIAAANAAGEAHLANNEVQAAIGNFQHLVMLAPTSGRAHLQLARAYFAAKDSDNARTYLEKAADLSPADPVVEQQFIRFAIEMNSVPKELEYLKGLSSKQQNDPAYDLFVGDLLMATNQPPEAVTIFQGALAKREDSVAAAIKLAEATARSDQGKGVDILTGWLQRHPDQNAARAVLGGMLISMIRYDEAISDYETVLKAEPDNAVVANNLAWLYERKHDERALPLAEHAFELDPNNLDFADTLGWILVQHGQNDRAIDLLGKAAKSETAPPEVQYHFAVALKNAGRREDARHRLEQALKTDLPFDGSAESKVLLKELSGG